MKWLKKKRPASSRYVVEGDPTYRQPAEVMRLHTGFNIATYNLQVFSPKVEPEKETSVYRWSESDKRVLADLPAMLELIEEQLMGLLPKGYTAQITEWDK